MSSASESAVRMLQLVTRVTIVVATGQGVHAHVD